jgi:hypothetical protein
MPGGHSDPLSGLVWPPCERTFRRVFTSAADKALNDAMHGYLAAVPASGRQELPEATRREREQRRGAGPHAARPQAAAASRDGRQGHPRRLVDEVSAEG